MEVGDENTWFTECLLFNKLAYISEQYAYELQKYNYKNGLIIKKQLSENNFDVTENQVYSVYQE